ncbi:MAG: cold shock domain-containing protein [Paracoccus sp. (in: a-proteobacteria)]|uniref:cold-shock protein n=1 Tax=Paracoccus sp. TaxID=267 RepID=UPI0026DEAA85|nr:cold shock domain-containing protein [Paracoccus sp. (in: a-proteobacteria)]MDO5620578.1 cold shock domain-containing protein [Paracoccus sp. (in: a-proteobacteria)]
MSETEQPITTRTGLVKWFDMDRGFGFVLDDADGPDILLHANVLRNFGQGSVAEGSRLVLRVVPTVRGVQAVEIVELSPPVLGNVPIIDLLDASPQDIESRPLLPARVKWFDKAKGFGFANLFGQSEDVFLHVEVLRHSGFSSLAVGEAVALRVIEGRRGLMAAQILAWDMAVQKDE